MKKIIIPLLLLLGCLAGSLTNAQQLVSSVASDVGGSLSLQNPLKTHPNANNWIIYNMTGPYGNSLQFWSYTNTTNLGARLTITDAGNMGIGTQSPVAKLDVNGSLNVNGTANASSYISSSIASNEGGGFGLLNPLKTAPTAASLWRIYNMTTAYGSNSLQFWAYSNTTNLGSKLTITDEGNMGIGLIAPAAKLDVAGNVRIGSVNMPAGYRLYVEQGILTERVKVALKTSANWADHVFAPDYKLKPLHEVEAFVKDKRHLPGIPSAQQLVQDGGIDVNMMFAKQMEKIEELTLHLIEMKKEIKQLQEENTTLKKISAQSKK
jgi:hypothetical protein